MARSSTERLWIAGGGMASVVLLLLGWFFLIGPQRSETDDLRSQADTVALQNVSVEQRLATLQQQNAQLPTFKAKLEAARRALPASDGVAAFLRTLQALGGATQTSVTALGVGAPEPLTPAAAAAPSAGASPSSAAPSSSAPAPSGAAAAPAGGVYSLPITAQVTGSAANLERFLEQLQDVQPRAVLVTSATTATGTAGGSTTLSLSMQAFVAPSAAGAPASATPAP